MSNRLLTAIRMAELTTGFHGGVRSLLQKADRVVAVCNWVLDLLVLNGVPRSKLVLCRQGAGAAAPSHAPTGPLPVTSSAPLRLAFFGRLDPMKGLDTILHAFKLMPDTRAALDVFGIIQPGSEGYVSTLNAQRDPRVQFRKAVPSADVGQVMYRYDFVVVPSRWLETGPLVVYEAFQAGTPVLGSRLGGIAELVTDGVDGLLLAAEDPESWATTITALSEDRGLVGRLRSGVRPPRTMSDVAEEMVQQYQTLLN
jgi:glycosyltransferase involved in cell wall biosynthesis